MITGIDHVVVAVRDLSAGVAAYETLLGAAPSQVSYEDGIAIFVLSNMAVELMAPAGASAARVQAAIEKDGEGLKSLVFAVDDVEAMHRRAVRMALGPEAIADRDGWRVFRANTEKTRGVRLFFLQREAALPVRASAVDGIDHVVLRTSDPDAAAGLYGARLGLDFRLDREVGGTRFLFFRCGDTVLEVVTDAKVAGDALWGLSWRVREIEATRARLEGAGLDVSEVRAGAKPGTRVITVRDKTCGVPTLMLEASPR